MIVICLAALAVAWWLWGLWAKITAPNTHSTVSLATVGGLGGLVALVVAYRKQAMSERNEVDGKLADAVHLLGDQMSSTRIAGVYALTNVGGRYPEKRQQIIDILCGYLRTKREDDGPTESAIINALKAKLNKDSWARDHDFDLDLHNATITETLDLSDIEIHDLVVGYATFNNQVTFSHTVFNGEIIFNRAVFNGYANFQYATFNGYTVFSHAIFNGYSAFGYAVFNDQVTFDTTTFNYSVAFNFATFNLMSVFNHAVFNNVSMFDNATFNNFATFNRIASVDDIRKKAKFNGGTTFDLVIFKTNVTAARPGTSHS